MGPLCPVLACPSCRASSVSSLLGSAACDVIVPIVSLIVSPYGFPSPFAPSSDTVGGACVCFLLRCLFVSARRGIIPALATHPTTVLIMLACAFASDCGGGGSLAYRLGSSAHPFRSHPPRPIDTRNGENGGAGLFSCLMLVSGLPDHSIA